MFKRICALAALAFLAQGCTFSVQTNPGDITELKSLVLANAVSARAPTAAPNPATIVVISPTASTATLAGATPPPDTPAPVTRRYAAERAPEIPERK